MTTKDRGEWKLVEREEEVDDLIQAEDRELEKKGRWIFFGS